MHVFVTTKCNGKTDRKEGKHQRRNSSQHQKERNSPNSSENEEIEAQQEQRGTESKETSATCHHNTEFWEATPHRQHI